MEIRTFFFDTYAFLEIIRGNNKYKNYSNTTIITTKLDLMELHYILLREKGAKIAEEYYDFFKEFCVKIDDEIIKKANEFRYKHKKKDLSYVDCIGYLIARTRNIKFLTGDKAFKGIQGVEFVK